MVIGASNALMILSENWWAVGLRVSRHSGRPARIFIATAHALTALVWLFGAYAFLDRLFNLVSAWRRARPSPRWALLLEAIAGLGPGSSAFSCQASRRPHWSM